jgi:lipopolysaccharide export system protein LptC
VISQSTAPNLIAKNVDAWQFDLQGQPKYRLLSATAQHYNTKNRTNFTVVTGYLYLPNEPYWQVKADTAVATDNYATVFLSGHVYLHQDAGAKNMAQTLTTDYLTIYPSKKIAQTDAPITATRPDMVTTSKGAYLDLNNNSVKLHQAYTIYTPSSTS